MHPQINKVYCPAIKFSLNKDLDKKICFSFLSYRKGGLDFGKFIIKTHPKLASTRGFSSDKQIKIIEEYTDFFYRTHRIQLKKRKEEFQEDWNRKLPQFFKAVDQIFSYHPWPKGPYFAYISIFPSGPRFLNYKSFQVFYLRRSRAQAIAHEILHFLFYDYLEKYFHSQDSSSENVWVLSEIVNTFILDSPKLRKILGSYHPHPYPAQKDLLFRLKPLWRQNNLYSFLKEAFAIVT